MRRPASCYGRSIPCRGRENRDPKLGLAAVGRIGPGRMFGASSRSMQGGGSSMRRWARPTSDFYGADRLGDGLYGNSLVALDARTGREEVAPATGASRPLGLRPGGAAGAVRYPPRWARHSGGCADHENGPVVRVRPRDRRAGLWSRRAARAANHGPRRGDRPNAAVSGEASAAGEEHIPVG